MLQYRSALDRKLFQGHSHRRTQLYQGQILATSPVGIFVAANDHRGPFTYVTGIDTDYTD